MDDFEVPEFTSPEEEIQYWKGLAHQLKERVDESEYFQECSSQLEKEYEKSLEQAEKNIRELRTKCNKLTMDLDFVRSECQQCNIQNSRLEQDVEEYKQRERRLLQYNRQLEQKNDDLERSLRAMVESVTDYEVKLTDSIEKNALLETELVEKEELKDLVQRLKDEIRDMQQELSRQLRLNLPDNDKAIERVRSPNLIDSNKLSMETQTNSPTSPLKISSSVDTLSVPTRVSAMNLVGDLLRKVGALEAKLAASRTARDSNNDSPAKDSYRVRHQRLSRNTASPPVQNGRV